MSTPGPRVVTGPMAPRNDLYASDATNISPNVCVTGATSGPSSSSGSAWTFSAAFQTSRSPSTSAFNLLISSLNAWSCSTFDLESPDSDVMRSMFKSGPASVNRFAWASRFAFSSARAAFKAGKSIVYSWLDWMNPAYTAAITSVKSDCSVSATMASRRSFTSPNCLKISTESSDSGGLP